MNTKEELPRLIKWANDGYPPLDLSNEFKAVIELIKYCKAKDNEKPESVPSPKGEQEEGGLNELLKKVNDFKDGKMIILYKWQVEDLVKASYNKALKDGINIFRHIRYVDTNITDYLGSIIGDGIKEVKKLKKR